MAIVLFRHLYCVEKNFLADMNERARRLVAVIHDHDAVPPSATIPISGL